MRAKGNTVHFGAWQVPRWDRPSGFVACRAPELSPSPEDDRVEKPVPQTVAWRSWWGRRFRLPTARARIKSWQAKAPAPPFFMKFRGPKAHPNRPRKAMVCPTCRKVNSIGEPYFHIGNLLRGRHPGRLGNHPEHVQHWNLRTFGAFLLGPVAEVRTIEASPWIIACCRPNQL